MPFLKQSTAAVISFGPFVDKTDGVTLEVGLVSALDHATTGIMLAKNGGALTIRHQAVTASTYDAHGDYLVTLDTTDTGTLGRLRVMYTDAATCLPVWQDYDIVTANVWDSLFSTAKLEVDLVYAHGTALTEAGGAGRLAAAISTFGDVATPVFTAACVNQAGDAHTHADAAATDAAAAHSAIDALVATVGAAGAGLTALGDTRLANLDAAISTRTKPADTQAGVTLVATCTNLTNAPANGDLTATMKASVTAAVPTAAAIADAVCDETINTGHAVANSVGKILFDNLNAPVGTVDTVVDGLATTLGAAGAGLTALGDTRLANLDAAISTRTKPADTQAGVTLVATCTNLTNAPANGDLTATMKASVTAAVPTAAAIKTAIEADGSKIDHLWEMTEDDAGTRRLTVNSLELAPTGGSAPTAVAIRQELDANSTQLAAIVADTNELQAELVDGGRTDLLIDGIKAKTDVIPASPAAVGSQMDLVNAPNATAVTALQSGLARTGADSDTLETLSDQIDAVTGGAAVNVTFEPSVEQ